MRVVLVRHGETEGQSSIRYHGVTDVPLSSLGREQMRRVRAALAGERFAAVYASTLSRALEGARIVAGHDSVHALAGFDEIDFGDWEGLTEDAIRARDPEGHARWRSRPADFHYPGGESTTAFHARAAATLHAVLGGAPAGSLLFVLHKGVIRSVLTELLGLASADRGRFAVDLASIHILAGVGGSWQPEILNRVDHQEVDSSGSSPFGRGQVRG